MLFKMTEVKYQPNKKLERALDVLFILHADHEQNCSTSAMRGIGSSHVDPYSAMAGAAAALYGPLHGGANEAVLKMLAEIGHRVWLQQLDMEKDHQRCRDAKRRERRTTHRSRCRLELKRISVIRTNGPVARLNGRNASSSLNRAA